MGSNMVFSRGLYRARRVIRQSNLLIISDKLQAISMALNSVTLHRSLLERYIHYHPEYESSLEPLEVEEDAPRVVKLATLASGVANVGPMAAIPGALADIAMGDMVCHDSSVSLVENGGEIAALSDRPLDVGVYAGSSPLSGRMGFHLLRDDFPIGIATSSSTVSHALSFGNADAAIIVARSASIADAVATAVCNSVRGDDVEASVQSGLELAETIPHIRGAIVIRGRYVGKVGKLPRLLKLDGDIEDLFKASLHELMPHNVRIL
ncbi:MAG: UPF0280 family protein [Nitrososphaerales archaeon]|nr:UPF0280 family protein [Nitrososphaerales archaeon]